MNNSVLQSKYQLVTEAVDDDGTLWDAMAKDAVLENPPEFHKLPKNMKIKVLQDLDLPRLVNYIDSNFQNMDDQTKVDVFNAARASGLVSGFNNDNFAKFIYTLIGTRAAIVVGRTKLPMPNVSFDYEATKDRLLSRPTKNNLDRLAKAYKFSYSKIIWDVSRWPYKTHYIQGVWNGPDGEVPLLYMRYTLPGLGGATKAIGPKGSVIISAVNTWSLHRIGLQ